MSKKKEAKEIREKEEDEKLLGLLHNKKIPILTLDERWHELFPDYEKTSKIKHLEKQLNNLIKEQGKMVTNIKDMKKLKTKLMDGIIQNMDASEIAAEDLKIRKQEKSQELIKDINEKLKETDNELLDMPYQIQQANEKLLLESIKLCYRKLRENAVEIEEIADWIPRAREELKNRILLKQDKEMKNEQIYTYMHNMLGSEVIEIFDKSKLNN